MQTPSTDILGTFIHVASDFREAPHPVLRELHAHAFGLQQSGVLRRQRGIRFREDAHEIFDLERLELDANREASLQLWNQIRRLGDMECPGSDEQHVVCLDRPVLGGHRAAFDERQQITLYALARYVGAVGVLSTADLVDFVDKHDAVLFGIAHGRRAQLFFVQQLASLFVEQQFGGLTHFHFART